MTDRDAAAVLSTATKVAEARALRGETISGKEYVLLHQWPSSMFESAGFLWLGYRLRDEYRVALNKGREP